MKDGYEVNRDAIRAEQGLPPVGAMQSFKASLTHLKAGIGKKNWKTTAWGIVSASALGYLGCRTGNYELLLASVGALGHGISAKDAQ